MGFPTGCKRLQHPTTWTNCNISAFPPTQEPCAGATIVHTVTQTGRVFAVSMLPRELSVVCGRQSDGWNQAKRTQRRQTNQKKKKNPACALFNKSPISSEIFCATASCDDMDRDPTVCMHRQLIQSNESRLFPPFTACRHIA
jgi:hypothetical protein